MADKKELSDTMPPLTPTGERRKLELQGMMALSPRDQNELDLLLGRRIVEPDDEAMAHNTERAMTPIEVARLKALQMSNGRSADEEAELAKLHEMAAFSAGADTRKDERASNRAAARDAERAAERAREDMPAPRPAAPADSRSAGIPMSATVVDSGGRTAPRG